MLLDMGAILFFGGRECTIFSGITLDPDAIQTNIVIFEWTAGQPRTSSAVWARAASRSPTLAGQRSAWSPTRASALRTSTPRWRSPPPWTERHCKPLECFSVNTPNDHQPW